jgi:hypothetical protein
MANYKEETCFVIGGYAYGGVLQSVSRYNIDNDIWVPGTPALNFPRACASVCSLGDSIFVFAGGS